MFIMHTSHGFVKYSKMIFDYVFSEAYRLQIHTPAKIAASPAARDNRN